MLLALRGFAHEEGAAASGHVRPATIRGMARGKRRGQRRPVAGGSTLCVCGSGRPHARCHGARGDTLVAPTADDLVAWAEEELFEELEAAREEFASAGGLDGSLGERAELLGLEWAILDRPLTDGQTPAEAFAQEGELSPAERERAEWLARARLSLHRVVALAPGEWLELEEAGSGRRLHVVAPLASETAAIGDLLPARVLPSDPPELWGAPTACPPERERELFAALALEERAPQALRLLGLQPAALPLAVRA